MSSIISDHLGNQIEIKNFKRIISLVPSQTELLIHLGLTSKIIGISNFCIHPKNLVANIEKVGGTKNPRLEKIKRLNPDIIIANKEENCKEHIDYFKSCNIPVWISDLRSYEDNYKLIGALGLLFNCSNKANKLITQIRANWSKHSNSIEKSCLYFIWRKPYMLAGQECFINACIDKAGYQNLIEETRYPSLNKEDLKKYKPDYIFLATEPYAFKEKHLNEFKEIFPTSIIKIVDGELFSWYGSRQLLLPDYLKSF